MFKKNMRGSYPTYAGIIRIRFMGMFSAAQLGWHPLDSILPSRCKVRE